MSQRAVELYVAGKLKRPRRDLCEHIEREVKRWWQPQIRAKPKKKAANVEIVARTPQVKGFVPQPKRWRIEQTYAVLILHRRLARDYEHRPSSASRVYWAMTHVMTRRLTGANGVVTLLGA